MGTICGILGRRDPEVVASMARAMRPRAEASHPHSEATFSVAASAPCGNPVCLIDGHPLDPNGGALEAAQFGERARKASARHKLEIRGAFAAAVRIEDGRWWLVRDRLGRKPLYYYQEGECLLFASELKGLLASGRVPKLVHLPAVDRYLALRCAPGEESIIQGVKRVPAGGIVEFAEGRLRTFPYAGFEFGFEKPTREEAAARLRAKLGEALEACESEALLWAGGIDCAALGALAPGRRPVFVQVERAWQDEARPARESARRLQLTLTEIAARRTTEDTFTRAFRCLDEPVADASVFPLYAVIEAAAKSYPCLISGHGADELLGGYPRYHFLQRVQGAQGLVPVTLLSGLLPSLPPNAFVRRGGGYLASIRDNFRKYLSLLSVFDEAERNSLYTDTMKAALHEHGDSLSSVRACFDEKDFTRNLLSFDLQIGLPDLLLAQCDRIAAAHGASIEFPYLDDCVVDAAIRLAPRLKFGVRSKPLLRMAMKGLLPGRVRLRARRYFRIPQQGRLLHVIENVARQVITQDRVESSGLFKWSAVDLVIRSASHNVFRRRQFWALLLFFGWYRQVMEC